MTAPVGALGKAARPADQAQMLPDPPTMARMLPDAVHEGSAGATLRPVEGDAAIAQRDPGIVADDEVVEEVDVE